VKSFNGMSWMSRAWRGVDRGSSLLRGTGCQSAGRATRRRAAMAMGDMGFLLLFEPDQTRRTLAAAALSVKDSGWRIAWPTSP
jgi:hypothetical protein